MTKSTLHSRNDIAYSSLIWFESQASEGVSYAVRRISLSQRIDLTGHVRELMLRYEFLRAGDPSDDLQANLVELQVQKLYIEWGLREIQGLTIDGEPATVEALIEKGPESLANEIASAIRGQLELSEEERKNF